MATRARPHTRAAAAAIVRAIPGAVLSGIVPDSAHLDSGGYHVGINDLRRFGNLGDYSSRRTLDQAPPVTPAGRDNACGIDVSMPKASMIKVYGNVERVWKARSTDTRTKYINAINVWSGKPGVAPVRFNFQTGTRTNANRSHEWHGHGDWPRVYVDDGYNRDSAERAARAMVSVWTGQTHDAWQRQEQLGPYAPTPKPPAATRPAPTPATPEDDTMPVILSHTLPARHAYRTPDTAGIIDASAILAISLPPVSNPEHSWGKTWRRPYISLAGDHMTEPQRVRVAMHDGNRWHVGIYQVTAGARVNVSVPTAATQAAYNVTVGRLAPDGLADDAPLPEPQGTIGVLVELLPQ